MSWCAICSDISALMELGWKFNTMLFNVIESGYVVCMYIASAICLSYD